MDELLTAMLSTNGRERARLSNSRGELFRLFAETPFRAEAAAAAGGGNAEAGQQASAAAAVVESLCSEGAEKALRDSSEFCALWARAE